MRDYMKANKLSQVSRRPSCCCAWHRCPRCRAYTDSGGRFYDHFCRPLFLFCVEPVFIPVVWLLALFVANAGIQCQISQATQISQAVISQWREIVSPSVFFFSVFRSAQLD